ncbi:d5-like helicase-primase: PROVISIONAL [Gigaspora margarita]|uniref:D5-like helicase-primase: PROVISIONAL n=1 Tax=Gigaspora margarita TaxID=4874 RepID=A0A8H4A5S1_GIGMA|nr:d5-like helicase-primase: PROVISIONAL [Gigaspora margarita]
MSAIATKIIEKYNLSSEMSVTDLSRYTSEFLENLTNDRKRNQARRRLREGFKFTSKQVIILIPNQRGGKNKIINLVEGSCRIVVTKPPKSSEEKIIREIAKRILQNIYGFSEGQVDDLFSIQENIQPKSKTTHKVPCSTVNIVISNRVPQETIGEMAHQLLRDKLSIWDIRAEAYALALSAKNANAVKATKFPDITEEANKIQRDDQKKAKANRIDYPDHFTLESVRERLDGYNVSTLPDKQALANVMVILCIRPAELTTLCIIDAGVTGYAKNQDQPDIPRKFRSMEKNQERARELLTWIQNAISSGQMGDPDKPGVKWFNRFLKNYDLIPKYQRKIGAIYGVVAHEAKNIAHAYTIAGQCLRHSPDNYTSPVQNYVIVNYRKKDQFPDQARLF